MQTFCDVETLRLFGCSIFLALKVRKEAGSYASKVSHSLCQYPEVLRIRLRMVLFQLEQACDIRLHIDIQLCRAGADRGALLAGEANDATRRAPFKPAQRSVG